MIRKIKESILGTILEEGEIEQFFHLLLMQIYFTFVQSIPLLLILGSVVGLASSFQENLSPLGKNDELGSFLVSILFREITPLGTSLILIARSVTAVASEMATMKVQQEIQALEIMGIDTKKFLIPPRVFSGIISLSCMSIVFWGFCLIGGWYGANWSSYVPISHFIGNVTDSLRPGDLLFFFFKSSITGGIVIHIAYTRGMSLNKAPFEVPIVTNKAVVDSLFFTVSFQITLSACFYFINGVGL
ncbi:MAG: ABC transporter permease [Halobacteriovoraceae bacterium]|nr:ABC transporter permease [Halobacteriovoraceae bacterium]